MTKRGRSRKTRIFTLDDQLAFLAGLKTALERRKGFVVVGEATSPRDAVVTARRLRPDVILLGVSEPSPSDVACIHELRKHAPEAKLVVLGTSDDATYIVGLLRAGARGYLKKLSSTRELVRGIRAVLRGEIFFSPVAGSELMQEAELAGPKPSAIVQKLSPRESEVLTLVSSGLTSRQIGQRLGISARTVETHRERIMRKLDIRTVAGLTRYAFANGLLEEP